MGGVNVCVWGGGLGSCFFSLCVWILVLRLANQTVCEYKIASYS